MISSMTGYGKATVSLSGIRMNIEVKALNSKNLDLSVKLPVAFREKEMEIRTMAAQLAERGKIDIYISSDAGTDSQNIQLNHDLIIKHYLDLKKLLSELGVESHESLMPVIMRLPDVIRAEKTEVSESDCTLLLGGTEDALQMMVESRKAEGAVLERDIVARVNLITSLLDSITPFEASRTQEIRDRIRTAFQNLTQADNPVSNIDANRFEQEIIYYLERTDFTEEKVRLVKHCEYFLSTIQEPASQGKKLGFIAQEIGREINTIGSKANHAGIQKLVVQMKDELEKVKEQLMNIL